MIHAECTPHALSGTVPAFPAQADACRKILAAALSRTPVKIQCSQLAADARQLLACLGALGTQVEKQGDTLFLKADAAPKSSVVLPCAESEAALCMLLPVTAALGLNVTFETAEAAPHRPVARWRTALATHGVEITPPWQKNIGVSGQLLPGHFRLQGNQQAQYISGLLFALPLLKENSTVELLSPVTCMAELSQTVETLSMFGIQIEKTETGFSVAGNQSYQSPSVLSVEGDWTYAVPFLLAGALGGPVCVTGLQMDSKQPDREILTALKSFGADVLVQTDAVTVTKKELHGQAFSAQKMLGLVPSLSVAGAACTDGLTAFTEAQSLRDADYDGLASIAETLTNLGVICAETDDGLVVWSGDGIRGGTLFGFKDARLMMAATVAAAYAREKTIIREIETLIDTYPKFMDAFRNLGGQLHLIEENEPEPAPPQNP